MAKKKSKWWSESDLKVINQFIDEANKNQEVMWNGVIKAAEHFNVSPQAVYLRYRKSKMGQNTSFLKRNTTKVPITRKAVQKPMVRKPKIEETTSVSTGNTISLDIKDVKLDLKNGKIVIVY
jgi:Zn-dependent peptidase ImmA (M78 family)